ncbi:unnamed protein product [[Candida] boidinii]|uniref:Unnamed protein product n=1 Tax=Candida boidinii TaxID=5477 RepID=A0A9W6SZH8_CANBO|nr:hypothetical protein B5S30_g3134 [[Candida] boidinii]GME69427.1 unnamed protein product [[Candida] boidinii]GMF99013.1 unnamed protein product [[Candida] boidinii]
MGPQDRRNMPGTEPGTATPEPFSPLFKESYSPGPDDVGSIESINSITIPEAVHSTNANPNTNPNLNPVKSILKKPTSPKNTDDSNLPNIDKITEPSFAEANIRRRKSIPVKKNLVDSIFVFKPTDNKGSTARDQLANERTFLAYIRTTTTLLLMSVTMIQIFKHKLNTLILDYLVSKIDELAKTGSIDGDNPIGTKKIEFINSNLKFMKIFVKPICLTFTSLSIFILITAIFRFFLNLNIMLKDNKFSIDRISMLLVFLTMISCSIFTLYGIILWTTKLL